MIFINNVYIISKKKCKKGWEEREEKSKRENKLLLK